MRYPWFRLMPDFEEERFTLSSRVYVAGYADGHPKPVTCSERNITKAVRKLRDEEGYLSGMCLVEWDIAIGIEEIAAFEEDIDQHRDDVLVAPYLIYPASTNLPEAVITHRHEKTATGFVQTGDTWCKYFGLGCVWLPPKAVNIMSYFNPPLRFPDADILFSERWGHGAAISWHCFPTHLHYTGETFPGAKS